MQQPKKTEPTLPVDGGGCRPPGETHVETQRSVDPNSMSIEDYNRVMLQYTQRRMSTFLDMGNDSGPPPIRSRSSESSGNSGVSTSGVLARQAAAPTSREAPPLRTSQTPDRKPTKHTGEPKTGL